LFLSFCILLAYSPLASKISDENAPHNLIKDSLYVMNHSSLAAFKVLFVWAGGLIQVVEVH
jgi:hypothetical protein